MFGAVVLIQAANVAEERDSPNEQQEESDADEAINQIEQHLIAEYRIDAPQGRGRHQRQELVHEDKKANRNECVHSDQPAGDMNVVACSGGRLCSRILLACDILQRHVRRELQRAKAQRHRGAQRHNAAENRPAHPFMLVALALQRLGVGDNLARGLAHGNAPGMRRAHHDAFKHCLAADERGFLSVFKDRQKLGRGQEPAKLTQILHIQLDDSTGESVANCCSIKISTLPVRVKQLTWRIEPQQCSALRIPLRPSQPQARKPKKCGLRRST